MRRLIFGLVLAAACSVFGEMPPVADRVAKQNALFEEYYQTNGGSMPPDLLQQRV